MAIIELERTQMNESNTAQLSVSTSAQLRYWEAEDAQTLLNLYKANEDLHRQLPRLVKLADAIESIEGFSSAHEDRAIFCVDIDGEACGLVGLSFEAKDEVTGSFDRAWVWYWSAGETRGKGLMKQAVKAVCDWAMGRLDIRHCWNGCKLLCEIESPQIRRLELGYRLNNPASAKVAEFSGFVVEGVERAKFKIDGELVDAAIAARL
ncbi:GNAT family protein [Alloscardovia omnicolens]|uniref:GNAT family N-acetyltransferase n=1 Tax=Alloscardovia omnicolens TaxID=419015 RepID=UPI00254EEE47|nr:GNAT family protein [Alloscardovia omnicolens]MDK8648995.1 GNAT family protein [Alloscardovia omnicolens]